MQPKHNVNEYVKIDSKFRNSIGEKKEETLVFVFKGKKWFMNKRCVSRIYPLVKINVGERLYLTIENKNLHETGR